jgi:hypothetical protein
MDKISYIRGVGLVIDTMHKEAKREYTKSQWRKYTTPEERQVLRRADNKISSNTAIKPLDMLIQVGTAPLQLGGMTAAALTPGWDIDDLKEYAEDTNGRRKSIWIPGYHGYKLMKVLGLQRKIQKRVEDMSRSDDKKSKGDDK